MGDMKIIFGVKLAHIDAHRPPTSWVCTAHGHRDIGSGWKFRVSQNGVKKGGAANFEIIKSGKSRFCLQRRVGRQERQSQTNLR